jgi:hypothetical protein
MEQEQNQNPIPPNDVAFPLVANNTRSWGPMLASVVIVLLLAGVAYYMVSNVSTEAKTDTSLSQLERHSPSATTAGAPSGTEDAAAAALSVQGTSDDLDAIDADLKATNLDSASEYVNSI